MSETDKEVSAVGPVSDRTSATRSLTPFPDLITQQILSTLASLSLEEHSDSSKRSPVTLETLPNELLSAIFLHLDDFILPPLSKRLLPFHRAQLYKKVTLDVKQEELFREVLASNEALRPFVESLVLNYDPSRNFGWDCDEKVPSWSMLSAMLPSLKEVSLNVEDLYSVRNYPKISDFDKNPRLERFLVRSWFYDEEEYHRGHKSSVFDWKVLLDYDTPHYLQQNTTLYEDQSDPEVILELRRLPDATFGLRYFAGESTEIQVHSILRETPISKIEIVAMTHQVHLDRLLSTVGHPSLLTHLSLFSFDRTTSHTPRKIDFLSRFPNITHLALGGTSLPNSLDFYDYLRLLLLESLHFGPKTSVKVQPLIDLVGELSKSGSTTLKRLVLENIDAKQPSEEDQEFSFSIEWIFPSWTTDCSEEKVKELKEVAKKLGIEVDGSTFRGLEIVRSAAYEAALEREAELTDEYVSEENDEDYSGMWDIEDIDDTDNERLEAFHAQLCGCWRHWDDCTRLRAMSRHV